MIKKQKISVFEASQRLSALEEFELIANMLVAPITPKSLLHAITLRKRELANSIDKDEIEDWKANIGRTGA